MEKIIVVCGKWKIDNTRWLFIVDKDRGSILVEADQQTRFDDILKVIYEDYGLYYVVHDLELSYMISKHSLQKLHHDTPPIRVGNLRQFHGFLGQCKTYNVRLCVEVKDKKSKHGIEEACESRENHDNSLHNDEDDDNDRFDYCDDSDGASSGDEDFSSYGVPPEEVDDVVDILPVTDSIVLLKTDTKDSPPVGLSSFKFVVGQSFDSKDDLETRLKILSIVQHFDFDVERSTTTLLIVKCWVDECTWKLRASPLGDSSQFTVRVYVPEHTCSVTERLSRSRQATPEILGLLYKDYIGGVDATILPRHVTISMNKRFGVKMEYWNAHRTLKVARELVIGSAENGYGELPVYLLMFPCSDSQLK